MLTGSAISLFKVEKNKLKRQKLTDLLLTMGATSYSSEDGSCHIISESEMLQENFRLSRPVEINTC